MKKATPQVSLAQQARDNFKKFEAEQTENVYNDLVAIIQDVSARGAIGLDLRHQTNYANDKTDVIANHGNIWHKDYASVEINIAPAINQEALAKLLEADGFEVTWYTNDYWGELIDRVIWLDQEAEDK